MVELEAPFSNGLVSERDAAYRYHFFDIAEAQRSEDLTRRNEDLGGE